ncbi:TPA: S66 family peptidase [Aeromonas veronii]
MTLLVPPLLQRGDTIGFFSPSSAATIWAPNRFARAKAFLEGQGFRLKAGSLTGQQDHWRSGSIAARAEELNALIRDPQVRCIMSVIGGSNSNSLLPYLDFEALRRDPKIIVGYSDVTALLLGIHAQTGLVTFYGPALVASGRVEGRLIGGNLNTMAGIWGSPYMPTIERGDILLLEDSLKSAETVERSFAHLKLCGVFDRIGGLILGKHELFNDQGSGKRPLDILLEVVGEPGFPILAEFDCAHTHPMLTLPLGIEVALDLDRQQLTLLQPWWRAE